MAPYSPWHNPLVERMIGSVRRECLDHVIVFDERYLRRILRKYVDYYHSCRTHWLLDAYSGHRDHLFQREPIAHRSVDV